MTNLTTNNTQQIEPVLQFNNTKQKELTSIATHSCQRYLFWTNSKLGSQTIERSTLDGDDVQIIVDKDLYFPTGITVDQKLNRIYWTDDTDGEHYLIESADLNGQHRQEILHARHHHPFNIIKIQEQIFWIDFNEIWTLNLNNDTMPHQLAKFKDVDMVQMTSLTSPFIPQEQCNAIIETIPTTKSLTSTSTTTMITSTSTPLSNNDNQQTTIVEEDNKQTTTTTTLECLNNGELYTNVHGNTICKCPAAYTGDRCEVEACHNFCMSGGICSIQGASEGASDYGAPQCLCPVGYTGLRCEINKCDQYCLNNGYCSINNETLEAQCACLDGFNGERCEMNNNGDQQEQLCRIICEQHDLYQILKSQHDTSLCKCVYDVNIPAASSNIQEELTSASQRGQETGASDETYGMFAKLQDPFVIVLIVLVIVLIPVNMALTTAVCWLKKRPRIKRRIIVNKNVTPLTSRPNDTRSPGPGDQCEITIENCCNMNICETPCFEPPQLRTSTKSSKTEEKKTLLTNMENGDDFY
ncbi:protein cueball [Chrysoperla carnea]|uniref:protein cueball n=1 Tax=Chrysoperla carnea TaxID=189513 RepID=UPI001D080443|nr:protein cueball [Chrysoperla carnea]